MRYGDDFVFIESNIDILKSKQKMAVTFLKDHLKLEINSKNDIFVRAKQGIHFLGVEIYPKGRKLSRRNWQKIIKKMNQENYSGYWGIVHKHCGLKKKHCLDWEIIK